MSDIKDWASVADLNGEASPNGWPEGMPPSDVNNSAREMMAAMRRSYVRQPWYAPGGDIVRASESRITIKDDAKVKDYSKFYSVNQRIRVEGVEYTVSGHITSVSYQDPTTTIEVELDAEQTLPGTITDVYVGLSPADVQGVAGPNLLGCIIGFTEESSQLGAGLMHANGEKFSPTLYPDLANLYFMGNDDNGDPTYRYGREQVGDAWWPKRPDFRGYFPRFLDDREAPQEGQDDTRVDLGAPRTVGSIQGDDNKEHNHSIKVYTGQENSKNPVGTYMPGYNFAASAQRGLWQTQTDALNEVAIATQGSETRPKNIAVVGVIIAYSGVVAAGVADVSEVVDEAKEAKELATRVADFVDNIGIIMRFIGTVPQYNNLPTGDSEVGDVYKVDADGINYMWMADGTWNPLARSTKITFDQIEGDLTDLPEFTGTISQIFDETSTKADKENTYTKSEVDAKIDEKVANKADKTDTYTKSEVDNKVTDAVSGKADKTDTYTKAETNAQITTAVSTKADKADTYTKTDVDNLLTTKADADNTYTKSEVDEKIKSGGGGSGATSLSELAIAGDNIVFTDDSSGKTQISANLSSCVQNKTTKNRALAIGVSPYGNVSGSGSVSIGTAKATQQNAIAIGADANGYTNMTQATGYRSIAIGTCYDNQGAAVASGNDSIAIGTRYTLSSGASGIAIGFGTTSSGNNSALAIGAGAMASSAYTSAYGAAAEATGIQSTAVGYYAQATARNAVQLGAGINGNANTLQFRGHQIVDDEGNIPADRTTANLYRSLIETAQAGEGLNIAINPVLNFTTVGTAVTVSDEYVASGFTGPSYLTTPMPLSGKESDSWEIGVAFVVSSLSSQQTIFRLFDSNNSLVGQMHVNTNGAIFFSVGVSLTSNSTFSTGSKVFVKVVHDASTSTYTMYTSTDGVTWSQQATKSTSAVTRFGTTINLGQAGTAVSLYLKKCYMSSAGTEVWRAVQGADKVQFGLNTSEVSVLGMPSVNFVDITEPANDAAVHYVAPANGYVYYGRRKTGNDDGVIYAVNAQTHIELNAANYRGSTVCTVLMPMKKGQTCILGRAGLNGQLIGCRFYYAEGEI